MIPKFYNILANIENEPLVHAWAMGSLVRQAAYMQLSALVCSLTHVADLPIQTWRCPDWLWDLIRPLGASEARKLMEDGRWAIRRRDASSGELKVLVAPPLCLDADIPVLNLTLDHCLVGSAGCYYLLAEHYLLKVQFDWFHELWNNVKNAAKHTVGGRMWRSILEFMIVVNYNHGPFRSGAWHASKKEALELYLSVSTWHSEDFQSVAPELAKHWGMPLNTADDYQAVFARLACRGGCTRS